MWAMEKVVVNTALAAVMLGWGFLGAAPAKASTYDVTFSGSNFDVSAVVTTSNSLDALGGYDITGISGTVTGPTDGAISGLVANPGQPFQGTYYDSSGLGWYYDNVLFAGSIPVDNNGILFSFGADIVANLYSVGSSFFLSVDDPSSFWNPGDPGTLQVTATPIPAALPLFATGLGLVGLLEWRRKRRKIAVMFTAG
jgi:hypothetical protein